MNGIFNESALGVISKIKKGFLWAAVGILIGGLMFGAILILMGTMNQTMGKILATMGILALVLFVGVNNFIRMEKGAKAIQILALVGLVTGVLAAVLGVLMVWEVMPAVEQVSSIWAKILSVLASLAGAGFWLSNVMSIKETIKVVKPLKITSVVCEIYCTIYAVVMVFISSSDIYRNEVFARMSALSGLAAFAFVVTALAAWIISRANGKKQAAASNTAPKTDEELRAEIEEKVRREMIEKEVREKMGADMKMENDTPKEPVLVTESFASEDYNFQNTTGSEGDDDGQQSTGLSSDGQF